VAPPSAPAPQHPPIVEPAFKGIREDLARKVRGLTPVLRGDRARRWSWCMVINCLDLSIQWCTSLQPVAHVPDLASHGDDGLVVVCLPRSCRTLGRACRTG
jgi:hypothetical protein